MVLIVKARTALRAAVCCDHILPNGSVPLTRNTSMTAARHISPFTVITTTIVSWLFYFRHFLRRGLWSTQPPVSPVVDTGGFIFLSGGKAVGAFNLM